MEFKEVVRRLDYKEIIGEFDKEIKGICADSRKVKEGDLFICLKGKVNGADYIPEIQDKICGVVTEEKLNVNLPQIIVKNARIAYAVITASIYGNPQDKLKIIGVVGTNGKTSCCYLLNRIFRLAGKKTAMLTTVEYEICGVRSPSILTTPDPDVFFPLLAQMVAKKVEYLFMEISAHAIYWNKLAGVRFKATIFTNCTPDHLDFFKSFREYSEIKKSWFSIANTNLAVLNTDDKLGREISKDCNCPFLTYGIETPGDVFAIDINYHENGTSFIVNMYDIVKRVNSGYFGKFNVYNMLAVCVVAGYFGIELSSILAVFDNARPIPGRFNLFTTQKGVKVIIDYAHTPDGLEKTLQTARSITKGKLITVFGCGGNRDMEKRKAMGEIASRLSDYLVITNDNPRDEEPEEIAHGIEAGVLQEEVNYSIVLDRTEAITQAFQGASKGDTLLIAGKGSENYIEVKGEKQPFSDYDIVKKLNGGSL